MTENIERGKSPNIRPGNVWVDIQQVFYRMEENVPGCYAQKPLVITSYSIHYTKLYDSTMTVSAKFGNGVYWLVSGSVEGVYISG